METRRDEDLRDKVFDLITGVRVAQMVALDRQGRLHSRPMVARRDRFGGELWPARPRP